MRTLRLIQTAILVALGMLCLATTVRGQQPDPAAGKVIRSWNEAIATIPAEDAAFQELLASFKRNPPGRVLLAPDVRHEQKKRRLRLINEIIASHEERIRALRRLAKAEEESQ